MKGTKTGRRAARISVAAGAHHHTPMWTEAHLSEGTVIRGQLHIILVLQHTYLWICSPHPKEFFFCGAYLFNLNLLQPCKVQSFLPPLHCLHFHVFLLGPMSSRFTHWAGTDKINTAQDAGVTLFHLPTPFSICYRGARTVQSTASAPQSMWHGPFASRLVKDFFLLWQKRFIKVSPDVQFCFKLLSEKKYKSFGIKSVYIYIYTVFQLCFWMFACSSAGSAECVHSTTLYYMCCRLIGILKI